MRRAVSVPVVLVLAAAVTSTLPLLLVLAVLVDSGRFALTRHKAVALRLVGFLQVYLLAEAVGVLALGAVWVCSFGRARLVRWTYAVQRGWTMVLFESLRWLFDLRYQVEGDECAARGPLLLFVQHASIVDTLVPSTFITRRHGLKLRFVLKRELLVSPCLDVAGHRLPNVFVDRAATQSEAEVAKIRQLATGLGDDEGALIYPEGTRFTPAKRERALSRLEQGHLPLLERARALQHVLPPRLGGPLALLEGAPGADVVFIAHHGLEGFAKVSDIWKGQLVHAVIRVRLWRVPRREVPADGPGRVDWLYGQWSQVDRWVEQQQRREAA